MSAPTAGVLGPPASATHGFGTTMGCESANAHHGGGNHVFVDGHAKRIARNSERYETFDAPTGLYYKTFYEVDK